MRINLGLGVIPAGVGAALFTAGAAAGPLIAVGAVLGVALGAAIYAMPIIGLSVDGVGRHRAADSRQRAYQRPSCQPGQDRGCPNAGYLGGA